MSIVMALICIFLICTGGWFVHIFDKNTPILKRLIAVAVTMIGVISLWILVATITPAVDEIKIKVISVHETGMVAELISTGSRKCTVENVNAYLTLPDKTRISVESNFIYGGRVENTDFGYLIIQNPDRYTAKYVDFTIKHWCPFGFQTNTNIPQSVLPPVQR